MKLLFDANISPRLVQLLEDLFPNSSHVQEHRFQQAEDEIVWAFAKRQCDLHARAVCLGESHTFAVHATERHSQSLVARAL